MAPGTPKTYHFAYQRFTGIGITAQTITIPKPAAGLTLEMVKVKVPSNQADSVRVAGEGVADANSFPVEPGQSEDLFHTEPALSVIANSGTLQLDVVGFWRS